MKTGVVMLAAMVLSGALLCGCSGVSKVGGPTPIASTPAATPTISTSTANGARNGAVIVSLATATANATIYYTLDGSSPTTSSQIYVAPVLVSSNLTVKAMATASGYATSAIASQTFSTGVASGTLVWSDEFSNSTTAAAQPNPSIWTYDIGLDCCGNNELETYCAWASSAAPCDPSHPNAFVGSDNYLHIVAQQPAAGQATYTSARLKTQNLFSFMYGRIEARILMPESRGMWPAFWLLGNNISTVSWPACGESDVVEHIGGANTPFGGPGTGPTPGYDWYQASIHGTNLGVGMPYGSTSLAYSAAAWHTYGMIWSKGQVQYYLDTPSNVYETFNSSTQAGTWPFDQGPQFLILNLAVGGSWPGSPDSTTVFPSTMLVDYVRIYAN